MKQEELLEKNNIILSHGNLPKGMSSCENYGLSGNCGINCPLFKNGTCEVYQDVTERIINNLQCKIDKINLFKLFLQERLLEHNDNINKGHNEFDKRDENEYILDKFIDFFKEDK